MANASKILFPEMRKSWSGGRVSPCLHKATPLRHKCGPSPLFRKKASRRREGEEIRAQSPMVDPISCTSWFRGRQLSGGGLVRTQSERESVSNILAA